MTESIRALVQQKVRDFTPSDQKILDVLLNNYPSAGLGPLSALAGLAGVSDPTVHRLVLKLGFDGFPAFQRALLAEVDERMNSPMALLEALPSDRPDGDAGKHVFAHLAKSLAKTAEQTHEADFQLAVDLLADTNRAVLCCGGRASAFLAWRAASHLNQIRPHTLQVEPSLDRSSAQLMDMKLGTVLMVYDYRRYQDSVIRFTRMAHELGAEIILLTDEWKSPIAEFARVTLTSAVQSLSAFDTKVPALAQTEALMAALLQAIPELARQRMRELEALRQTEAF
ncbi:MurR/RpiR family transcriptional regulator [Bordetella sp. N]|uniref:MurR/RpiR family transcriptional regulator n=1 Tax=Bordetella sp. N TaxID=1746199 RepID=UPI00070BFE7D|nr:MurR/RpiR family transcriptional regulator [Bordetella sp. N]ALM82360.1 hypothetical protein ASB57_04740 [Bordetella sp. N]